MNNKVLNYQYTICRTCLQEVYFLNTIHMERIIPNFSLPGIPSVNLIHILQKCMPYMNLTAMMKPMAFICKSCYESLSTFYVTKMKFESAETMLPLKNPLFCRVCSKPYVSSTFSVDSVLDIFYRSVLHTNFNKDIRTIRLCHQCFEKLSQIMPFSKTCYDTSMKISSFLSTFSGIDPAHNNLIEVVKYCSIPVWQKETGKDTTRNKTINMETTNNNNVCQNRIEIVNKTKIKIISKHGNSSHEERRKRKKKYKERSRKGKEKQETSTNSHIPDNLLIKFNKNIGTYEVHKTISSSNFIDLTYDSGSEKEDIVGKYSSNYQEYQLVLDDFEVEEDCESDSKKPPKELKKGEWEEYSYNSLLCTMQSHGPKYSSNEQPLDVDWEKISSHFHSNFDKSDRFFDVREGWTSLMKLAVDYVSNRKTVCQMEDLLKRVIEHVKLKPPKPYDISDICDVSEFQAESSGKSRTISAASSTEDDSNDGGLRDAPDWFKIESFGTVANDGMEKEDFQETGYCNINVKNEENTVEEVSEENYSEFIKEEHHFESIKNEFTNIDLDTNNENLHDEDLTFHGNNLKDDSDEEITFVAVKYLDDDCTDISTINGEHVSLEQLLAKDLEELNPLEDQNSYAKKENYPVLPKSVIIANPSYCGKEKCQLEIATSANKDFSPGNFSGLQSCVDDRELDHYIEMAKRKSMQTKKDDIFGEVEDIRTWNAISYTV